MDVSIKGVLGVHPLLDLRKIRIICGGYNGYEMRNIWEDDELNKDMCLLSCYNVTLW